MDVNLIYNPEILIPDRPIAFNRDFVRLGIGVNAALFLSQAMYWSRRTKDIDGWFYKTNEEWQDETGLSKEEQLTCKKRLISMGVMIVEKRGIPARNYFKIEIEKLADALSNVLHDRIVNVQSSGMPTTSRRETRQHSITESTTYIRGSEKNEDIIASPSSSDGDVREPKPTRTKADTSYRAIFKLWGKYPFHWNNRNQEVDAAKNLLSEHGIEMVKKVFEFYLENRDNKHCPSITSPYALDTKWSRLADFKRRQDMS